MTLERRVIEYKMSAWWWWSVPYSIVCPLFAAAFGLEKYGHSLMLPPYALLFITWISSTLWAIAALYRLGVSHSMQWSRKMMPMVMLSVVGAGLWPLMEELTSFIIRR